jgi:hypothetical protein
MSEPQWRVFGNTLDLQTPYDAAVVIPSVGRPALARALRSIYAQAGVRRLQVLIGIDKATHDLSALSGVLGECPAHITVCLFNPGYSTSVRHGGIHLARDGGSLRSVLTLLANSLHVAYLDDDNWWGASHVADLLQAIRGKAWAFSLRWMVHPANLRPVCIDRWESLGPGRGVYQPKFDGFVDPNCLMLNKLQVWECVALWSIPIVGEDKGMSADRNVFNYLRKHSAPGETGKASVFYLMDPSDVMGERRRLRIGPLYDEVGALEPLQTPGAAAG